MRTHRILILSVTLLVLSFLAPDAFSYLPSAQASTGAASLPTTREILARYVQAIGGKDAVQNVTSMTTQIQIEIPAAKLRFTATSYSKLFKQLDKAAVPGRGEFRSGYDGKTAWSIDPQDGARVLQGNTVESLKRDADIYYPLHEADYFRVYEIAGIEQVGGRECYHIKGITNWGKENNQYYDVKTGLLVAYRFASDSSGDPVMNVQLFDDYKSFGGPLVPTRITVKHGEEIMQVLTVLSVSYAALDDSLFDLPEPVKKLIKP